MTGKRAWALIFAAFAGVFMVAATGEVTRDEFSALVKHVSTLEAKVNENAGQLVLLKGRMDRLEREIHPPAAQAARAGQPLKGDDLAAWKLAHDAIERDAARFMRSIVSGEATTVSVRRTALGDYEFLFWRSSREFYPQATLPDGRPNAVPAFVTVETIGTELRVKYHPIAKGHEEVAWSDTPSDPAVWR